MRCYSPAISRTPDKTCKESHQLRINVSVSILYARTARVTHVAIRQVARRLLRAAGLRRRRSSDAVVTPWQPEPEPNPNPNTGPNLR